VDFWGLSVESVAGELEIGSKGWGKEPDIIRSRWDCWVDDCGRSKVL
jgi:hypothetical protein